MIIEDNFIFKLTSFMWSNFNVLTNSTNKLPLKTYGTFMTISIDSRKKVSYINIDMSKVSHYSTSEREKMFTYILLHEIGHFLLEKSNFIQKEEYANYLAIFLLKNLLDIKINDNFLKNVNKNFNIYGSFFIDEKIKEELSSIGNLFVYKFNKFSCFSKKL